MMLQANGVGRDFLSDDSVYLFDMYNRSIYPQDGYAKSESADPCFRLTLTVLAKQLMAPRTPFGHM